MTELGLNKALEVIRQLENHEGPYYDKWLAAYTKSVRTRCKAIADHYRPTDSKKWSRWYQGMCSFIDHPPKG